jgi:5-methylcytosine-specific restriction endonuclease McrA
MKTYLPFEDARAFVRSLGLKSYKEWAIFCKSGDIPASVPKSPNIIYKTQWQGVGDWLGTGTIAPQCRKFLPFEEAREYVRSLGIKGRKEWDIYCKSGEKPTNIPSDPSCRIYSTQFEGYNDWLGTVRRVGRGGGRPQRDGCVNLEYIREQRRIRGRNRRARKRAILGTHTSQQIQELLKRQHCRCYYCSARFEKRNGNYSYHVDHTFPLSRVIGTDIPANDISYLVLACPRCNDSKGTKFPWEWFEGGRLL